MVKNILISTDFSIDSLTILVNFLKNKELEQKEIKYIVHLVSGYDTGNSIRDLLFVNKGMILSKIKSNEFDEACSIIRNKYQSQIQTIKFDLFSGYFQRTFNQYLKANEIEEVYYAVKKSKKLDANMFDLNVFIKKNKTIQKEEIVLLPTQYTYKNERVAEIFV